MTDQEERREIMQRWPTLSAVMQDIHVNIPPLMLPSYEPKKRQAPGAYHSSKEIAAGLHVMVGENAEDIASGKNVIPQRITAQAICYAVINQDVPVYYVADEFIRAVAATELPKDLRIEELKWPMPGLVFGFPTKFMHDYLGVDTCYVYACQQWKKPMACKYFPGAPEIEATQDRVSWMWYTWVNGRMENFVSSYWNESLAEAITKDFDYTDWTGASKDVIAKNKEATDKVSLLMLKLLCVLNWRDGLIGEEKLARPIKIRRGVRVGPAIWSPIIIGANYRQPRKIVEGTHASPQMHRRAAHWTYQAIGKKDEFVSVTALPRTPDGYIDWVKVDEATKQGFWRTHKRIWIDVAIVGLNGSSSPTGAGKEKCVDMLGTKGRLESPPENPRA